MKLEKTSNLGDLVNQAHQAKKDNEEL